jgi:tetratricopeptide (TPR) repeat protein
LNYVTGFEGEFEGNFIFPTSIAYDGELLIVTDSTETRTIITVFEPTEFGALVNYANYLTYVGDSLDAADVWAEILNMNTNYSLAYIGIGHAYYRQKEFLLAMESYRLGQDRINYSKAYKEYRRIQFEQNFPIIGSIIFIGVFALLAVPIIKDLRKES